MRADQRLLMEMPEQPSPETPCGAGGRVKLQYVTRDQTMLAQIVVDELIGPDHKARAMWELTGRLDLSRFEEALKTREGQAGRAAWEPRLLISLWVYAYSEGISSAREIERLMEWEPGLQWLGGLRVVNHHTLSDFRVEHREALDALFTQVLGLLEAEGLLSLERVMHDGTKIRAQAGADTFRREKSLRDHLERARQVVQSMEDPRADPPARDRQQAAKERAARERQQRLEHALEELEVLQEAAREAEKPDVRVSLVEPEARLMKHGDNAIAPSYNAQITTEAQNKLIVGAHLTQCSSDAQSLLPSLEEEVQRRLERMPAQVVVDGGFTNKDSIVRCAQENVDLIGSLTDPAQRSAAAMKSFGIDPAFGPYQFRILEQAKQLECPAGRWLNYVRQSRKDGEVYFQFQANGEDCRACEHRSRCCPKSAEQGRTVSLRIEERAEVAAFREKMKQAEAQQIYRLRGAVAEFPHAWMKDKLKLRKFRLRGLLKAGTELLWACLTYNLLQWLRLRRQSAAAMA